MGLLERYHASPHRQKINNVLMVAGFLSLSVPLLAEGVQFILRFRRRTDDKTVTRRAPSKIYRVVVSGGPCSGKTSSLTHLRDACKHAGYEVLVVPEVPTLLMQGGALYPGLDGGPRLVAFEVALIQLQMQMEESFAMIAHSTGQPTVILHDRGSVDVAAYLMPSDWLAVLSALGGLSTLDLASRYHQVVHLVTAADGAPSFYTLSNNASRTESAKDSRVIDRRIKSAWSLHPHQVIIGNETDFAGKLAKATDVVLVGAHKFFSEASKETGDIEEGGCGGGENFERSRFK